MPRLFTGLELPPEIADDLRRLKAPIPGARWIDASDLHVTLRFAGDVEKRVASEFVECLERITVPVFEMRLSGLGVFGGQDPHSLWARVEAGPELEQLYRAHERAARLAGLKPETRGFHPHVTIARLKHARDDALARFLSRHGAFRTAPIVVERFVLFSSRPSVGGGPYVVEEAFPLAGAAFDHDMDDTRERW